MTLLILPFTSLLGWNHKWVVSSLMIFSIGRTTVSGLNFGGELEAIGAAPFLALSPVPLIQLLGLPLTSGDG